VLDAVGPEVAYETRFEHSWYALATLAHEFGHTMGLPHAGGIMRSGVAWDVLTDDGSALLPGVITAANCADAEEARR
jgi:hypothetical protein